MFHTVHSKTTPDCVIPGLVSPENLGYVFKFLVRLFLMRGAVLCSLIPVTFPKLRSPHPRKVDTVTVTVTVTPTATVKP